MVKVMWAMVNVMWAMVNVMLAMVKVAWATVKVAWATEKVVWARVNGDLVTVKVWRARVAWLAVGVVSGCHHSTPGPHHNSQHVLILSTMTATCEAACGQAGLHSHLCGKKRYDCPPATLI